MLFGGIRTGPFFGLLRPRPAADATGANEGRPSAGSGPADASILKVLYVASDQVVPGRSGGSVHVLEVARGLAPRGHEVHVAVNGRSGTPPDLPGVRWHRVCWTPPSRFAGCVTDLNGPEDGPTSGTFSGVAPGVTLPNYNVFPCIGGGSTAFDGSAFSHDIAAAIEDALLDGMDVANLSLGGTVQGPHDFLAEAAECCGRRRNGDGHRGRQRWPWRQHHRLARLGREGDPRARAPTRTSWASR